MSAGALHPMNTIFCYFQSSLEEKANVLLGITCLVLTSE